jgi:hypothetical protein
VNATVDVGQRFFGMSNASLALDAISGIGSVTSLKACASVMYALIGAPAALLGAAITVACAIYAVVFALPQALASACVRASIGGAIGDTYKFYCALVHYIILDRPYPSSHFTGNLQAQCQVYSLALVYKMWSQPHYRNGDFSEDMAKNLRNVAIPGTGVPLSAVCCYKPVAVAFLLVGYPVAALVAALNLHGRDSAKVAQAFSAQLLNPQDWFSFWQLNCRLATHHSYHTKAAGYGMEDKLDFLLKAKAEGIAVTPWLTMPKLIVKHRNEEGGLGFHAFGNCTAGGNWIIQEALENDDFVSSLLPGKAPLSTFRVISASRGGMQLDQKMSAKERQANVTALSCVFRAGREGAVTDHVSVLYDVDMKTGVIGEGTTNMHWYQLGLGSIFTTPWTNSTSMTTHPDTDREVTGTKLPDMPAMLEFVERAHALMVS